VRRLSSQVTPLEFAVPHELAMHAPCYRCYLRIDELLRLARLLLSALRQRQIGPCHRRLDLRTELTLLTAALNTPHNKKHEFWNASRFALRTLELTDMWLFPPLFNTSLFTVASQVAYEAHGVYRLSSQVTLLEFAGSP